MIEEDHILLAQEEGLVDGVRPLKCALIMERMAIWSILMTRSMVINPTLSQELVMEA